MPCCGPHDVALLWSSFGPITLSLHSGLSCVLCRALDINSDGLARDIGTMQAQVQGACESNMSLQQELHSARTAYSASEEQRAKMQAELAGSLEANAALAGQAKRFELEIQVASQQLQAEMQR